MPMKKPQKPPQATGRNFELELQRARQPSAKTRTAIRQMLQQAREIVEASHKRVMASMKIAT